MKRKDKDGNLICRVPRQCPSLECSFQKAQDMYDEEALKCLQALGFTEEDIYGNIQPDTEHTGGRWYYPAEPGALNFLPTIPAIAMSVCAATNVQKCDRKFLMSYLLKYNAGMDEKAQITFYSKKDEDAVEAESTGQQHLKITGQRMLTTDDKKPAPLA